MIGRSGHASECPHRPEAQDVALSRPRHGFESRWGRHFDAEILRKTFVVLVPAA
jgi:hypothetical protein